MNDVIEKEYRISKEKCAEASKGLVCSCCGKPVEPLETVDNSNNPTYWAGCMDCGRFDFGTKPMIFAIAKDMVDNRNYIAYSYLGVKYNHPEKEWDEWYRSQYGGTVSHVRDFISAYELVSGMKLVQEEDSK